MRSGLAVVVLVVCAGLAGCNNNKSNKEATVLPPPPPLESEPLPASLSTAPANISPAPAPATPAPAEPQAKWEPTPAPQPSAAPEAKPVYHSNGQTYVVQKGDTLYSITKKFYGSGKNWKTIADLNNISDPHKLYVGMELVLP